MVAILTHLRAEARSRWPSWLAVVVLIGLVGGLVLGALSGARRTHTAYDRLVQRGEAWDVLIVPNEGAESAIEPDAVGALAEVAAYGTLDGGAAALVRDGEPTLGSGPLVLAARDNRVLVEFSRPRVVEGTLYDPADPTQILVDDLVSDHYGIRAGDQVEVATGVLEDLLEWEMAGAEGPPPVTPRAVTVAGVVTAHDGIVEDEAFAYGHVYLTPAFARAHDLNPFFFAVAVRLQPGVEVRELRAAVQAMAPEEAIEFKTAAAVRDTVTRGVMPHTIALLLFAAVVGLAGLVVAGQATARQLTPLRQDAGGLMAMGMDRRQLHHAGLLRAAALVGAGTALAILVAIALSPLFPLGVAQRAEIAPGVDVDGTVLVPSALGFAVLLLAWSATSVHRIGRPAAAPRPPARPGWTERLTTTLSSPIATTGLRAALTGGTGARTAPVRASVGGLSLAVAAVAATVTFGANIDHLVGSPAAYGWAWDAYVSLPSEEWETPPEEFLIRAEASPELTGWSLLTMDQLTLDGERVPAVGIDYRSGDVGPTILAGRRPEVSDEIVLGGRTMDLLGVDIGDRVDGGGRSLKVVGQAVFAGLGTYPGADRTELGKGALVTIETAEELGEGFGFTSLVLAADDEAGLEAALDRLVGDQQTAIELEEIELHRAPALPADVRSLSRVRSTQLIVAGVLAVLGGAAFAFVLVSGVRSRRREIALLKTFGFERRDVAGTLAWQATATAVVACAVGVPLGIVSGRIGWSILADVLGVAGDARVPPDLAVMVLGVLVVANLIAAVPGAVAARTRPAPMLRAE